MLRIENIELVKSADKITKVTEDSISEYMKKMDMIACKINEVMLNRKDILMLIGGEKNINMMKYNNTNNMHFIASILQTPNSETLVETILWGFCAHMSRGFISNYWVEQIKTSIGLLKENISKKGFYEILSIYNWTSVNIPQFTLVTEQKLKQFDKNQRI